MLCLEACWTLTANIVILLYVNNILQKNIQLQVAFVDFSSFDLKCVWNNVPAPTVSKTPIHALVWCRDFCMHSVGLSHVSYTTLVNRVLYKRRISCTFGHFVLCVEPSFTYRQVASHQNVGRCELWVEPSLTYRHVAFHQNVVRSELWVEPSLWMQLHILALHKDMASLMYALYGSDSF